MRRWCLAILLLAACQKDDTPEFHATCKPDSTLSGMECTVENVGKTTGRACFTAREQPPKAQPLIARRLCTKVLAPGEKQTGMTPKFELVENLQPKCSPDGTWICKDEIVETPQMLGQNLPAEHKK